MVKGRLLITLVLSGLVFGSQQLKALSSVTVKNSPLNTKSASLAQAQLPTSVKVEPDRIEIPLGREVVILPDGTRVEPDGKIFKPNGLMIELIRRSDGSFVGPQLILPDGTRLKPGEERTLSDGSKVIQPQLAP